MRMRHPDGQDIHIAYCTNVHAGEDLETILAQLESFAVPVRRHLGTDLLGLGLWLAAPAARELARQPGQVDRLRTALSRRGLEVVTLNGFPYRGFQEPVVKHRVYQPDWTEQARLDYTLQLATVLAGLLPDDAARGSISTLPLGWRSPWYADRQSLAVEQLGRLADGLQSLRAGTGRSIRVGLEPEPGCVVETVAEAIQRTVGVDRDMIGICLDLCHLAVQFEDQQTALAGLDAEGLPIVKAQVSAGLHAADPHDPDTRAALESFVEPRFLHQVREAAPTGLLRGRDDLPEALHGQRALGVHDHSGPRPWRVHFHVPLGMEPDPPLASTRDHLGTSLDLLVGEATARTDHLEVETYTWSVLPESARPRTEEDLARSIAGEVAWLRDALLDRGLKEQA